MVSGDSQESVCLLRQTTTIASPLTTVADWSHGRRRTACSG